MYKIGQLAKKNYLCPEMLTRFFFAFSRVFRLFVGAGKAIRRTFWWTRVQSFGRLSSRWMQRRAGHGNGLGAANRSKTHYGLQGRERCAKCGNFSSISSNKHVNNGQKRDCSEEALVSTQGAANCIKWLINSSKALAINGGTAAETGRVVCFLLRKLCSSVFRLS